MKLNIFDKINFLDNDSGNKFRLVCDKLEDLEVRCRYFRNKWFNFALNNNLKKLTLSVCAGGPSNDFLLKIISHWPNLIELTIAPVDKLSANDVVQFLSTCKHLQRLNISQVSTHHTNININIKLKELEAKFQEELEWKLVPVITECCYFELSIIRKSFVP